ncbi:MAG: SCO family protein [Opitutales bacterium]
MGILCLGGCSGTGESLGLSPGEVRFEIVGLDQASLLAEAKVLAAGSSDGGRWPEEGAVIRLTLTRGDAAYLETGDVCRGQLGDSSEGVFQIEGIWPDGTGIREGLEQANRNLRRDVERRKGDAAREVGALLPEFAVIDQDGELLDASFLEGKITLINFFFTRCPNPDMCPAATQRLKVMLEKAPESGLVNLQALSLSFDPEHDSPGILKDYAHAYQLDETRFRFGTGPSQVMDDLRRQIGIATRKDPKLVIDHTFRIAVVDERRRVVAEILGPNWSVENTLARIRALVQEEEK